jgi:hypothetical protein
MEMNIKALNLRGVSQQTNKLWYVTITVYLEEGSWPRRRNVPLGYYETFDEAFKVRIEAEILWHGRTSNPTRAALAKPGFEKYINYADQIIATVSPRC